MPDETAPCSFTLFPTSGEYHTSKAVAPVRRRTVAGEAD